MKSFCQASDQAFWPSLASKEESVTIVVKVEPEMAATNAHASALTSTRTLTLRNRIGASVLTSTRTLTLRNRIGSVANSVTVFQRNHILPSEHPKFDLAYTCCTLPQSLLALQKTPIQTVSNHGLRRCYNKGELSTMTVVQFNNDTAYDVAKTVENFSASVHLSYASNEKGWFFLEQTATELVLWNHTDGGKLSSICNSVPYKDTVFTLSLNDSNLPVYFNYFNYPSLYMRMAIEYNCSDCNVCSPGEIMSALKKSQTSFLVPIDQWVECSGFGADISPLYPCNAAPSYHGRCNLYPTFDISMSSRLEEVIETLESMNSSLNITTRTSNGQKGIEMHANVLYYNQSMVVEKNNVTYGYFKIDPSTDPIWPILVASYPNILGSCLNMETSNVSVCNGTSICSVYKELDESGVSTAALNCIDFSQDYDSCLYMAKVSGNENIRDQLCERNSPSCQNVPPYQVKYPVTDLAKTLPDTMSVSTIMNNSWLQTYINGVCSRERRVGPAADTDDSTNGGDQSNAGSSAPSRESTSSRQNLNIVAGQSQSTKTLESPPVERVVEQTIQPGATTTSGNPFMRIYCPLYHTESNVPISDYVRDNVNLVSATHDRPKFCTSYNCSSLMLILAA
ncbi:unnamed protein product [Sphagnum balticum]